MEAANLGGMVRDRVRIDLCAGEIYELWRHPTPMKALVLAANLTIVAYLAFVRIRALRTR